MTIFSLAVNQSAYLKAGLLGFQGSGKTYTACNIAIGLHKYIKSKKPIMFLDTETGADWAIPMFEKEKIPFHSSKTRAFRQLCPAIAEAEKNGSILIIDSITHFWNELLESFMKAKDIQRLTFRHWNILKPEWRTFSEKFTNSKLHILVCGRAGWEWNEEVDEEGFKEQVKGGTKMKAEGEFGFEPNLVIEMVRKKGDYIGNPCNHIAHIVKDRRTDDKTLDGKSFENPKFEDFLPHIESLALNKNHIGFTNETSEEIFITDETNKMSYEKKTRIKNGLIEEFNGLLEFHYAGTTKENKLAKAALKKYIFDTYSETQISEIDIVGLSDGLKKLTRILESSDKEDKVGKIIEELSNHKKEEK
jgi:hypothetical protein